MMFEMKKKKENSYQRLEGVNALEEREEEKNGKHEKIILVYSRLYYNKLLWFFL